MLDPHDGNAATMHIADRADENVAFGLGEAAGDFVQQ